MTATAGGVTATNTYNNAGNAIGSTLKNSGNTLSITTSATVTSDFNHTKTSTDGNGSTTTYNYNSLTEQLTSVKNAKNVTTQYAYNSAGRIEKTSQNDIEIDYIYNNGLLGTLGRTTKDSAGSTVYQGYTFEANAWGQTTAIGIASSANGTTWTKSFNLVTYTYEDYVSNAAGSGGGNLKQMKYGNDDTVDYTYDEFDRLISMVYNSGKYVAYTYNSEGALAVLEYGKNSTVLGVYRFEYDSLGRLIRSGEADGDGNLIQRTEHIYDEYSRLKSQSWIVGTTSYSESYTYSDGENGNGSLSQMTTATGATISYTYDTLQRLNKKTVKNGEATIYTNANTFRTNGTSTTTQIEYHNVRDASGEVLTGARYEYDALGNITKIYESEIAEGETARRVLAEYEYDDQNQLISETIRTYGTTPTTTTYTYTYDTAGNLITEEKNDVVTKTYTYSTGAWKDRLDSINGYAISYDAIGNPEVYRNGTLSSWDDPVTYYMDWENGRQLTYLEVWGDWQQRIIYDYDADGIRTYKNVEGITHSYITQNGKVVRETIGSGTTAKVLDFIYDESGKPFALKYTNGTAEPVIYYYVLNLQGDVVKLITESGTAVASYTYTAWGEILTSSGTMASINPLRYRGYYYDTETGFYYLQSRYYDPVLHRFINADAAEYSAMSAVELNGTNLFAYCQNNPVNGIDPTGEWSLFGAVVGAVVGAVAGVVGQVVSDITTSIMTGEVNFSSWQSYVGSAVGGAAGGAVLALTGSTNAANVVTGSVTTFVGQSLEKLTDDDCDRTWGEILYNTAMDGTASFVTGKLPGINKITKGRNSFESVYKAGLTKLRNNIVRRMSLKVATKGFVATTVGGYGMNLYTSLNEAIQYWGDRLAQ